MEALRSLDTFDTRIGFITFESKDKALFSIKRLIMSEASVFITLVLWPVIQFRIF